MSGNAKKNSAEKVKLNSFKDLFGGSAEPENSVEKIVNTPLSDLHTFKDHPLWSA